MMKNIKLDAIKVGAEHKFSDVFIDNVNIGVFADAMEDVHIMYVTGKAWGQSSFKKYEFSYPSDWWQAIKQRFAPRWFLRRYPVKETHHIIDVDVVYPELSKKIKLPKESHKLILHGHSYNDEE